MTYQNLCEKGTKPMEKVLDQSVIPVRRKKPPKNTVFQKSEILGSFWAFSQNWYYPNPNPNSNFDHMIHLPRLIVGDLVSGQGRG